MMASSGSRHALAKLSYLVNFKPIASINSARRKAPTSFSSMLLQICQKSPAFSQCRSLHSSNVVRNTKTYEHDGKTTITILNSEKDAPLMVDSYSQRGFKLNNGMRVLGPMAIFPKTVLGWDVGSSKDISPAALALFAILEPKPDILVIGVGDQGQGVPRETIQFLRMRKINMEILATDHACTTFNFLNVEGRRVAAVLIPPTRIIWTDSDVYNRKLDRIRMYGKQDNDSDEFNIGSYNEKFRKPDGKKTELGMGERDSRDKP